jgi:hypothetical protein
MARISDFDFIEFDDKDLEQEPETVEAEPPLV